MVLLINRKEVKTMSKFIDYLGNKSSILDFIDSGIGKYLNEGDTVLDIFAGSGVVSNMLSKKYHTISNDVEAYSAILCSAQFNVPKLNEKSILKFKECLLTEKQNLVEQEVAHKQIEKEKEFISNKDIHGLDKLYNAHETVWNSKTITPKSLRKKNQYNLFFRYYAGTYFGLEQAIEIDAVIKSIRKIDSQYSDFLYSQLFLTINDVVFSRDGHMAQPLSLLKNSERAFIERSKDVLNIFINYLLDNSNKYRTSKYKNKVYNLEFTNLLEEKSIFEKADLVYADPPYTDMQYSRYYHILNVVADYDYPELTRYRNGFTKGLYTEGRFQSSLSQRSKAKDNLNILMKKCFESDKILALSYAYPRDIEQQKTDRYTISIEDLISMAKDIFSPVHVHVEQINYYHSNNKNTKKKPVIEYLILCGENKKTISEKYNIANIKKELSAIKPTNRNEIYNTHIYWSQKSFNVIDVLIENLSKPNDIIFDPFMGSGVTILQAITKAHGRNAIGCDINEAPIFIVKSIVEYAKDDSLQDELMDFIEQLKSLSHYYRASCPKCGSNTIIDRIIFDKPYRNSNDIKINVVNHQCGICGRVIENNNLQKYKEEMFSQYPLENIYSNYKFVENSKVAVIENDSIFNIFTNRNLKVLDRILGLSKKYSSNTENIIKYILMSCMHQCKITDKRSNSQWPLWIPKKDCVERNVLLLVNKKVNNFLKSLPTIRKEYKTSNIVSSVEEFSSNSALLLQKPSQNLSNDDIPDNSVDLVITDPPYLGQVLYSEYMQLYSPILGLSIDMEDEIVISSRAEHDKSEENYYDDLRKVFEIISSKLKKDRVLCLYFHDNSLKVWNKLIQILYEEGFRYIGQTHIEKSNTLKNIISPQKSLKGDSILFFRNTKYKDIYRDGPEEIEEIELNMIKEAKFMLQNHKQLTSAELYDNGLMETLITNSWLNKLSNKYTSLIDLLQEHLKWNKKLAVWENFTDEKKSSF